MKPYAALLFVAMAFISLTARGQTSSANEVFKYTFTPTKNGAKATYLGRSHTFTFNIEGKTVKEQLVKGADDNLHFIDIDKKTLFQTSTVPMPQPLPAGFNPDKLTIAQQKDAIEGYVNYEIAYYDEIGIKPIKLKKDWIYINAKLYMLWEFDVNFKQPGTAPANQVKGQVYLATACFNQMWVTNIPLTDTKDREKAKSKLKQIAATLKLYNKRLAVK